MLVVGNEIKAFFLEEDPAKLDVEVVQGPQCLFEVLTSMAKRHGGTCYSYVTSLAAYSLVR